MSMNGTPAGAVILVVPIGDAPSSSCDCLSALGRAGERGEEPVEPLVALVPVRLVAGQPLRGLAQRLGLEVAEAGGGPPVAGDEAGSLEDLEVPRDRRVRHRQSNPPLPHRPPPPRPPPAGGGGPPGRVGSARAPKTASSWSFAIHNHHVME